MNHCTTTEFNNLKSNNINLPLLVKRVKSTYDDRVEVDSVHVQPLDLLQVGHLSTGRNNPEAYSKKIIIYRSGLSTRLLGSKLINLGFNKL